MPWHRFLRAGSPWSRGHTFRFVGPRPGVPDLPPGSESLNLGHHRRDIRQFDFSSRMRGLLCHELAYASQARRFYFEDLGVDGKRQPLRRSRSACLAASARAGKRRCHRRPKRAPTRLTEHTACVSPRIPTLRRRWSERELATLSSTFVAALVKGRPFGRGARVGPDQRDERGSAGGVPNRAAQRKRTVPAAQVRPEDPCRHLQVTRGMQSAPAAETEISQGPKTPTAERSKPPRSHFR